MNEDFGKMSNKLNKYGESGVIDKEGRLKDLDVDHRDREIVNERDEEDEEYEDEEEGDEDDNYASPVLVPMTARDLESVPMSDMKIKIYRMCCKILRTFGPGQREKVYQRALMVALHHAKIFARDEAPIFYYYYDTPVGVGYADIIVENRLILELKAVSRHITKSDMDQLSCYMRATGITQGLVINFSKCASRLGGRVEMYDMFLGASMPNEPLSAEDIEEVDSGILGPQTRKRKQMDNYADMNAIINGKPEKDKEEDDEDVRSVDNVVRRVDNVGRRVDNVIRRVDDVVRKRPNTNNDNNNNGAWVKIETQDLITTTFCKK